MQCRIFGTAEGRDVSEVTLSLENGTTAKILTWGAVLRNLTVPCSGSMQSVVLGLNSIEDYLAYSPHFGAVPGRFANRIGGAKFEIDGKTHYVTPNKGSVHCLHGGPNGYGKRHWTLGDVMQTSVSLHLDSPDGDAGFPGHARITCTYTLLQPAILRLDLVAISDAPTMAPSCRNGPPRVQYHVTLLSAPIEARPRLSGRLNVLLSSPAP